MVGFHHVVTPVHARPYVRLCEVSMVMRSRRWLYALSPYGYAQRQCDYAHRMGAGTRRVSRAVSASQAAGGMTWGSAPRYGG